MHSIETLVHVHSEKVVLLSHSMGSLVLHYFYNFAENKQPGWVQLVKGERSGRSEALDRAGEVKVEPEEGVVDDIPELQLLRAVVPKFVGTGEQGIFEHVNSGPELLPNDGSPSRIHFKTPGDFRSAGFATADKKPPTDPNMTI
jgi:hypothetical protein